MDYKVNGNAVQCTYDLVREAFITQVFDKLYIDLASLPNTVFFAHLGVDNEDAARDAVSDLCNSAQTGTDKM